MTDKFIAPEIPESHALFAQEIADVARKYGVESFTMDYRPDFDNRLKHHIDGTLKIHFSKADGRGRPANNLCILLSTNLRMTISATPESCS